MKIKREKKFIASHNRKTEWNIIIGISPKEEHIKIENRERPFQYIRIWNYEFITNVELSKLSYLYKGTLTNINEQCINIYVINNNDNALISKNVNPSIYLFHKEMGNDVWECLFFTNNFKSWKDKVIETDDCKVSMKNIIYSLIGCNCITDL